MLLLSTVTVLLLVLGWLIFRRRKLLAESLATEEPSQTGEMPLAGAPASDVPGVEPSAQLSEGTSASAAISSPYSGFGGFDEEVEETDVVSEADVYIAYGRYREAESLLEEEMGKSPGRTDLQHKLAEAYYGSRNLHAIEQLMAEMKRTGSDRADPDQWQRLVTMARDLRSADAADAAGAEAPTPAPGGGGGEEGARSTPTSAAWAPEASLDAGLDVGRPRIEEPQRRTPATPISFSQDRFSEGLELDVEDLDVISGVPQSPDAEAVGGAASDLELQLEDLESLRDIDLSRFSEKEPRIGSNTEQPTEAPPAGTQPPEIAPAEKDSVASDVLSSQWQMDSGVWDEVATKIDLARAYIEMEDPEAARVILEEVAREGNEDQCAEANEMLSRLP
jgi:pilus assembly protein FimV